MGIAYYDSPAGLMQITSGNGCITAADFCPQCTLPEDNDAVTDACIAQLKEYFAGNRREFSLPLAAEGTPFQKQVWAQLMRIPYGETRSYKEIAQALGRPTATRAVGGANNRNPICIIVPCHRVIGADGSLTGYAGGVAIKEFLLRLEREHR